MKVLHVSTGYDISFNGGITNYVRNISNSMVQKGLDVTVLYSQDNGDKKNYSFKTININTILRPFHLSSVISNGDLEKVDSIIKELAPDIIHVHMIIDLPLRIIEVFKKYSKVIISLHDYSYVCNRIILLDRQGKLCIDNNQNKKCNSCISFEETIDNKYIGGLLRKALKSLKINKLSNSFGHHEKFLEGRKIFKHVDGLLAVSRRVKEIYQKNEFDNDLFLVEHIGNYTADETFRSNFQGRKIIDKKQKLKIGFIGNLNYHKGSDIFLKIIENEMHEFHIYGGIDESVLKIIKSKTNVFYHGRYNHDELVDILKQIDIGLVLSIWEDNAPQVVFEFLNAKIPIIATKIGGIPDFVNSSNGFLFENNNEGIRSVLNLLNSSEIYDLYNSAIRNIIRTKTAEEHLEEIIEIYHQVL